MNELVHIHNHMNESKQKKPDTEDYVLRDLIYMNSRTSKVICRNKAYQWWLNEVRGWGREVSVVLTAKGYQKVFWRSWKHSISGFKTH